MTETEVRQRFKEFDNAGERPDLLFIRFGDGEEVKKAEIKRGRDVLFSYPDRFRHREDGLSWRHFSCQPVV